MQLLRLTVSKLVLPVVLGHLYLEGLVVADERSEPGERLAPAAADTDQQHVAARLPDHAHNLRH